MACATGGLISKPQQVEGAEVGKRGQQRVVEPGAARERPQRCWRERGGATSAAPPRRRESTKDGAEDDEGVSLSPAVATLAE